MVGAPVIKPKSNTISNAKGSWAWKEMIHGRGGPDQAQIKRQTRLDLNYSSTRGVQ